MGAIHSIVSGTMLTSTDWRVKGNQAYQAAGQAGLSPVLIISRLQTALNAYFKADQCAASPDEKASALKNYAKTSWWLASQKCKQAEAVNLVQNVLIEAFKHWSKAMKYGSDKSSEWKVDMVKSLERWFDFSSQYYIDTTSGPRRARLFEELGRVLPNGKSKGQCYISMGRALYYQGLEDIQNHLYKSSLSLAKDCYFPLEEAARLLNDQESRSEIDILREDVFLLTCISESVQARVTGDAMLNKLLLEEEDLNMDLVFSTIDWYTGAVVLTRDKEIEFEAAAVSRLGRVYAQVLKLKFRAKEYYRKSVELGLTLLPRSPENEEWYKEAKAYLLKCQKEELTKERKLWENVRKRHIGSLKDAISNLDKIAAKDDNEKLLRHIYKTHPPKNKTHVIYDGKSPWDNSTQKKALMKALTHYHPDKIDIEEHGGKWKVLCEEITKVLNKRYTYYCECVWNE